MKHRAIYIFNTIVWYSKPFIEQTTKLCPSVSKFINLFWIHLFNILLILQIIIIKEYNIDYIHYYIALIHTF